MMEQSRQQRRQASSSVCSESTEHEVYTTCGCLWRCRRRKNDNEDDIFRERLSSHGTMLSLPRIVSSSSSQPSTNNNLLAIPAHCTTLARGTLVLHDNEFRVEASIRDGLTPLLDLRQLSARSINPATRVTGILAPAHHAYFYDPVQLQELNRGGILFSFSCPTELTEYETEMVDAVVNLSSFKNEGVDNYVPHVDIRRDFDQYTVVLTKSAYLLPGKRRMTDLLTPTLLASYDYQNECQPHGTKIWNDSPPETFRMTKTILPAVYSITVQFHVSVVDKCHYARLSSLVGYQVDYALLLERTKRSKPPKQDRTRKAKSILLYAHIDGGVLVSNITVICQSGLPHVIERVISTFGVRGLGEVCVTAERTRAFLEKYEHEREEEASV